jgi:hypothetical protein
MLVPMPCRGTQDQIPVHPGYEWVKTLPNKQIYFALFQRSPNPLPAGYDYYIVSFHLEAVDLSWLKQQQVTGPIIVLFDGNDYGCSIPNVHFLPFFYWHHQLERINQWFGVHPKQQPKHKFSAVCNRITQSKVWITTKLLEVSRESSLIKLSSWLEEKNVHAWQLTGNKTLDDLTEIFVNKYRGKEILIDDFVNAQHNVQNITGNPWQPLYQDSAVHFTNESFHYSGMFENGKHYVWPGPFITEKTLKCLLGATAFVPVGQFETYKTLSQLGFEFDYNFDIAWDLDPGNLTRAEGIVNLIDYLNQFDIRALELLTLESNRFNQNHIISGKFFQICNQTNLESLDQIFKLIA